MPSAAMMLSGAVTIHGGSGGYAFYRTVTIDHTKVGSTDSTNFPVLVSLSGQTFLKTVGNGGKVQNANGYDIGFFADSALNTKLDWEVEKWDGTTGDWIGWVRVPTVSHTSDTVIYLAYDSTTITTNQSNGTGVWDSNYTAVHHYGDGTTLSLADSTANGKNGTGNNTPVAATGQIYGGITHTGDSNQWESFSTGDPTSRNNTTISCWAKPTSNVSNRGFMSWGHTSAPADTVAWQNVQNDFGTLKFYADNGYRETSASLSVGTWYYLVMTLAGGTTWKFYKDGALLSTYTGGTTNRDSLSTVLYVHSGYNGQSFSVIDEFRLSYTTRSADWITAEYNNQNSPGTFYTVGSETAT